MTGAATGIGRATARRLAADGAAVVVNYIGDASPATEVVGEIEGDGGRAVAIPADVSDEQQVREMFSRAREELRGAVDLLVNNAGVQAHYPLEEMPLEEWQRVLGVNLTGPFLCSREFVRGDPPPGSTVVNVSSVHERIPWRGFSHYCASKGGLRLFTETIAVELGARGIRVASVAPGAIVVERSRGVLDEPERLREQEEQTASGRLGEPEEIAAAIAWLAGPDAEYVTGATLFVDGGMTLYPNFI